MAPCGEDGGCSGCFWPISDPPPCLGSHPTPLGHGPSFRRRPAPTILSAVAPRTQTEREQVSDLLDQRPAFPDGLLHRACTLSFPGQQCGHRGGKVTLQSYGLECAVPPGSHGGFRHTCSFCLVWGHTHSPREACLWGLAPYPVRPPPPPASTPRPPPPPAWTASRLGGWMWPHYLVCLGERYWLGS